MEATTKRFLEKLFDAAVAAADPETALKPFVPEPPKGRVVVIGAGKGAAQMAAAFERLWQHPLSGVVVTRYGYAVPCKHINVLEASHPVPDAAGLAASQALMDAVSGLSEDDLVISLICGGGSALLPMPPEGLSLADEQAMNTALLTSGAPIGVMNAVRKHVSGIKGGRLAIAAAPARVLNLVVSDVPGDDPAQVASGPTVPSRVDLAETKALIRHYGIELPKEIMNHLDHAPEAPHVDDPAFAGMETHVVASARLSLEAAAKTAEGQGVRAVILSDSIEGEAADVGMVHAAIAREVVARARPFAPPVVVLSGGETTVTLRHKGGRGGRNSTFLLGFAKSISGFANIAALAADTDGIDGSEDNAGAFADGGSAARMRQAGIDPQAALTAQDAWGAFAAVDDLFVPGPTGTNVNDFRAIFVGS